MRLLCNCCGKDCSDDAFITPNGHLLCPACMELCAATHDNIKASPERIAVATGQVNQ
jgi:hypothetical protein